MKTFLIIAFNLLALYLLGAFIFNEGGMINNTRKMNQIYELRAEKLDEMIELEKLEYELNYLRSMESPDPNQLARLGEKYENTVIFKFDGESSGSIDAEPANLLSITGENEIRVYVMLGAVIILLIAGNLALVLKLARSA